MSDLEQRVANLEQAVEQLVSNVNLINDNAKLRTKLLADMTYNMGMRLADINLALAREDFKETKLLFEKLHKVWDEIEKIGRDGHNEQ